ncbi:hypothetical protein WJX77_003862 [Trebouxia sp. C0004]
MHFRIPQALDGFVAAAVAGHVVSKLDFARASAKTGLHSLQPHLRLQQAKSQGHPDRQLDWSKDCCAEAYSMLCTVSEAGWPSRTLLLLMARFLSKVGAAVIQKATNGRTVTVAEGGNPSAPGGQPVEVSLALTIFFGCQMLQHTEDTAPVLQQWLSSPAKGTAAMKKVRGDVAQQWLEVKASALQDLLAYQEAVVGGCLSPAADRRNAGKLIWSTVVELAANDWQPPHGKGNKGQQQNVQAAITEAAEAAVSMLAAVADYATTDAHAASHAVAKKQKDQAADHAHQQAAAMTVLLEYASKEKEHQMVMLELFFCKVATHAAFSDSINARKLAVELADRQMTIRSHKGALFDAALLLLKAGKSLPDDKDANIRVKAVGIMGSTAADTRLRSHHSHAELVVLLTHRIQQDVAMLGLPFAPYFISRSSVQNAQNAANKVLHKLPALVTGAATEADAVTSSFVHKLLAMDLDTSTHAQLLQAWLPACGTPSLQAWQSFLGTCSTSQVNRMAGIMASARHECCTLLQQSYQQLYNLLGAVEEEERTVTITPEQACSIAAALKVIYVLGGVSQKAQDVPGELALLLDILDLVLHHSATLKDAEVHDQTKLISIKTAASTCDHARRHSMDIADMDIINDTASAAKGAQTANLTDCMLWGLHAVNAAAKMACVHKSQACSKMLNKYVLERMVLFSKDWLLVTGQVAVEVLYSLPKPQQATVRALKQLETALLLVLPDESANMVLPSESAHTAFTTSEFSAATHAEETATQRLTVSFLMLLGRMADNYHLEKAAFLKQLLESHGALAGPDADEAAPHSPVSPGVTQTAKRPKTGMSPHAESIADALSTADEAAALCRMNGASETAEGFDYMQAGKESSQAAALAQEYMDKLLDESAPASYLPMLASLAKTTSLPVAIRVAAVRSLGQLSVLSEDLSLQCSPLISSILSTMQKSATDQLKPGALMRRAPDGLEGQEGQKSHQRGGTGQLSSQADPTQRTADPSEGPTGTSAVLADASKGPTECLQGPSDTSQKPSAPSQTDADKVSQLEPASGQNSQMTINRHAPSINRQAPLADADAAVAKKATADISTELMLLDNAPLASEAVEAAAPVHAESVLLEAIQVATIMVDTYPNAHDELVSALANGLRQALGGSGGVAPTAITTAPAVAVASLILHERFKWGQTIGLLGEAVASDNPQVLVEELMTNADMRADAVISPALQNVLLMLSASEAHGLAAGADLLQHLVPSQKHLTMLHRHVQDNTDTLQHCSEQVVAHLVDFVSNFAGPVQATSEGPSKTDAGSKRASKAVQSALLTALQALRPNNTMQKGRKAKRKVVQEQESEHTGQSREELQLYKQAVAKMKEISEMPKVGRITDLFKES